MKYKILDEWFSTKTQLKARVDEVVGDRINGRDPYTGYDREFLMEFFSHHHEWKRKLQGYSTDEIGLQLRWVPNPYRTGSGSYGVCIVRQEPGRDRLTVLDDISMKTALTCLEPAALTAAAKG